MISLLSIFADTKSVGSTSSELEIRVASLPQMLTISEKGAFRALGIMLPMIRDTIVWARLSRCRHARSRVEEALERNWGLVGSG